MRVNYIKSSYKKKKCKNGFVSSLPPSIVLFVPYYLKCLWCRTSVDSQLGAAADHGD